MFKNDFKDDLFGAETHPVYNVLIDELSKAKCKKSELQEQLNNYSHVSK